MVPLRRALCCMSVAWVFALGCSDDGNDDESGGIGGAAGEAPIDPRTGNRACDIEATVAACKADFAAEGVCSEVSECACNNCACWYEYCEQDADCSAIRACVEQTGCTGVFCYQPGTCQAVIDEHKGVTAEPTAYALKIELCLRDAQCPSSCD